MLKFTSHYKSRGYVLRIMRKTCFSPFKPYLELRETLLSNIYAVWKCIRGKSATVAGRKADECISPKALIKTRTGRMFFFFFGQGSKINDRFAPILVVICNWNDVICLSRSAEFARCVVACCLKLSRLCQKS